jgi:DNA (cytosine-5)-methyltransferase 1
VIYGSVCSGIEAATVAWHPIGWKAAWYSEIEKFPSAVLANRYPNTPNLGDMTRLHDNPGRTPIELLVGGTPCQSFSVAGLRAGMADPRGNLALVFLKLADVARPRWIVWENVPGVLSSNGGRDFASFLAALGQLGYGWAYRVLDAQNFGVPQRRRRVFVVGYLGDWRHSAAVLFERYCLSGDSTKGRKTGEETAYCLGTRSSDGRNERGDGSGNQIAGPVLYDPNQVTSKTNRSNPSPGDPCHTLPGTQNRTILCPGQSILDMRGNGNGRTSPTITGDHASRPTDYTPIVFSQELTPKVASRELSNSLDATGGKRMSVMERSSVRRLTPVECERLQGFPDNHTRIPWRKKPAEDCPDGPRYKAIGNSMAVPVMAWIGKRIQMVEAVK